MRIRAVRRRSSTSRHVIRNSEATFVWFGLVWLMLGAPKEGSAHPEPHPKQATLHRRNFVCSVCASFGLSELKVDFTTRYLENFNRLEVLK